jgi:tetratricopeptide (TPR) repeat protein
MMRARWLPLFLSLLLASSVCLNQAGAAGTPEAERQARRSFQSAEAHFKTGLFAEALAEYQAGYDVLPLPGFLINIAQCQRRLGDLTQARTTYRKFIMVAPDSPFVPQVQALITELDKLTSDLEDAAKANTAATENEQAKQAGASGTAGERLPSSAASSAGPSEPSLVSSPAIPAVRENQGRRWWLWGSVGAAAVVVATVAVLAFRSPDATTLHEGSLGTLRR